MIRGEYCLATLISVPERPIRHEDRLAEALSAVESDLDELGPAGWEAAVAVTGVGARRRPSR